ncbi:MAG: hypothetical protein K2M47_06725 [Clostridiales bacterium]|nr:hypothetical protein [Clostridiales bacterium]
MTKKEMNEKAKEILLHAIARAYYDLDTEDLFECFTEKEHDFISKKIDQYGKAMAKAIGKKYYTV